VTGVPAATLTLDVDPRSVRLARDHVRTTLTAAGLHDLLDDATLAVSEVVTNAIVHAGTEVQLRVLTDDAAVRVEVEDRGLQLPVRRAHSGAAGTGRGLALVEDTVQRWGVVELEDGKVVWFEVGFPEHGPAGDDEDPHVRPAREAVRVELRQVPLLMHWAWQEHAAALLREFLLHALGDEELDVLTQHAHASEAMSLLHAQLPVPDLGSDPAALMTDATEPRVSADRIVVDVPLTAVPHFVTLDLLLQRGVEEAEAGHFLSPVTQPEIVEMRRWLCGEVARQSAGGATAIPWDPRTDVTVTVEDQAVLDAAYSWLGETDDALLATDEGSVVVAASQAALRLLGHASRGDLIGRRLVSVMPERFRQAHIAGTTLHATNGRDTLLDVPVRVPMVRADGTEVDVEMVVRTEPDEDGRRVFVARFEAV